MRSHPPELEETMTVRLKEKLLIPFKEDLSETLDQRLQVAASVLSVLSSLDI
jgi:hypothetical protein